MEIKINLSAERDAYIIENPDEWIHQSQRERVIEMIQESISKDTPSNSNSDKIRRHDTILISGSRGTGKTTFVLSLFDYIKKNPKIIHSYKTFEIMDLIDPTLVEEKGHILLSVITKIYSKIKAQEQILRHNINKSEEYKSWEKYFKKLADGLPSIDGIGGNILDNSEWLDSHFIMNNGLDRVTAANNFECNFNKFIEYSLKLLEKDFFLLGFDDIDTDFKKGWMVLEALRKYMTSPKLITILTGDISLFTILVRNHQWEKFTDRFLKYDLYEETRRESIHNTINHLEEQYLLKIIKPERRIVLDTLFQQSIKNKIYVVYGLKPEDKAELKNFYKKMFLALGILINNNEYYPFIASLPIRTQKQIMLAYHRYSHAQEGIGDLEQLSRTIIEVFLSDLEYSGINTGLITTYETLVIPEILNYLEKHNIFETGYDLRTIYKKSQINSSQFIWNILLAKMFESKPRYIFDFLIKVGLTRNIAVKLSSLSIKSVRPTLTDFIEYTSANTDLETSKVAHYATVFLRALKAYAPEVRNLTFEDSKTYLGTAALFSFYSSVKKQKEHRLDHILKNQENRTKEILGMLPLASAVNEHGEVTPIYSFYRILGIISELLDIKEKYVDKQKRSEDLQPKENKIRQEVRQLLNSKAQPVERIYPNFSNFGLTVKDQSDSEIDDTHEISGEIGDDKEALYSAVVTWLTLSEDIKINPSTLAKISTRFFYALSASDSGADAKGSLGRFFHRVIVVFLYAVLLEELDEETAVQLEKLDDETNVETGPELLRTNPTGSDANFISALKKLQESVNKDKWKLPFFMWLIKSPLIISYLDPDKEKKGKSESVLGLIHKLNTSVGNSTEKLETDFNVSQLLNNVEIKGNKSLVDTQNANNDKINFSSRNGEHLSALNDRLASYGKNPKDYDKPEEITALINRLRQDNKFMYIISLNALKPALRNLSPHEQK